MDKTDLSITPGDDDDDDRAAGKSGRGLESGCMLLPSSMSEMEAAMRRKKSTKVKV